MAQPIFVFGLHEGVRLWLRDPGLRVALADDPQACGAADKDVVRVAWDASRIRRL